MLSRYFKLPCFVLPCFALCVRVYLVSLFARACSVFGHRVVEEASKYKELNYY
jgi:hypothetical protein